MHMQVMKRGREQEQVLQTKMLNTFICIKLL